MSLVIINGKEYVGNHVSILDNRITVDGQDVTDRGCGNILHIEITGGLASLETDASVTCNTVYGSVNAGGSVHCRDVAEDVIAGGNVHCNKVSGNIKAGGSVLHK